MANLSPVQEQVLLNVASVAHDMIVELARTGSPYHLDSVQEFQTIWNGARPAVDAVFPGRWTRLVVDGQYGPKTAGALGIVTGTGGGWGFQSLPPTRASQMSAWYAQNVGAVDSMVAPTAAPPPAVISAPAAAGGAVPAAAQQQSSALPPEVVDAVQNSSGSTVMTATAATVSSPGQGDITFTDADGQPQVIEHADVVRQTAVDLAETRIPGTQRRGGVPFWAIGLGALALGGGLWMLGRKKR